ncbi:MAG: FtsQ-type POTRA domain-containing protein [Ruminococcus sp.]|nr:FtsQ-type POTRA domain-containing protein [Ruminococcus sp.]
MKDIEKTSVDRVNSRKRIRRRRRLLNVYVVIVLVLVAVIGFAASYTFLFNVTEIRVSGESDMYSAQEIVDASEIHEGDNLLRLDTEKSQELILKNLLYVETAEVTRDFPSSLEIRVTKCTPSFNVSTGSKTLVISRQGKILAENSFITDGLPVIYGYMPNSRELGTYIDSEDNFKQDAFEALISSIARLEEENITSINMADEHAIIVNYKNGMVFKMGNWNDAEYKLNMAATVMNMPYVKGKKGYLTMIGSNQCGFRTSDEPVEVPGNIEPDKKKKTDENGDPIDEPEPSGETNPDQEERFSDYNNQNGEEREDYFNFGEDENEDGEDTQKPTNEEGYTLDENGGYYDSDGFYHDQWGYYYDSYGNYYDPYGNMVGSPYDDSGYSDGGYYDDSYDYGGDQQW